MIGSVLQKMGWLDALRASGPRRLLAINALVDSFGLGITAVVIPFFVIRAVGLGETEFAVLLTAAGVAELVATVPAGGIAGKVGVHRYSVLSRVGRGLALAGVCLASDFWLLLVLLVLLGLLRAGTFGLSQSLTAAVVGAENRSRVMAENRALRNIGYLVSGSLGGLLISVDSESVLRWGLALNAATYFVSALLLRRLRPATRPAPPERMDWSVLRDHRYLALTIVGGVFASTVLVLDVALPLWVLANDLPTWIVGVVVVGNTLLAVVLQVRVAQTADTTKGALRHLRISTVFFLLTAAAFALSGVVGAAATGLVLFACLMMTFAELTEGPAWWTLSYEVAPEDKKDEYLSAFDINEALLNIAGPLLMVAVVSAGPAGWAGYGVVVLVALGAALLLVRSMGERQSVAVPTTGASA